MTIWFYFKPHEVTTAIQQLANKKACGLDGISAEHLKLAGPRCESKKSNFCFSQIKKVGFLGFTMMYIICEYHKN